jgi:glucokinase
MNDANAGALAEWRFGAGRGTRNLVFLTFGTGIGAGLILNGCLYEGQNGQAGEIGHVRLEHTGPVGYGKAGSVEGFCSGGGIAQIAREEARQHGGKVAFAPPDDSGESVQALHVGQAAENGDALACRILEEVGRNLGRALAVLVDVLNPERIVIGGIYPRCRRFLEPGIRETLDREALAEARSVCRIVPAELGERIGGFAPLAVALNARTEP